MYQYLAHGKLDLVLHLKVISVMRSHHNKYSFSTFMKYCFEINSGEILNRSIYIFEDRFTTLASHFFYLNILFRSMKYKLISRFKCSRCLNNWLDMLNKIGLFSNVSTTTLVSKQWIHFFFSNICDLTYNFAICRGKI